MLGGERHALPCGGAAIQHPRASSAATTASELRMKPSIQRPFGPAERPSNFRLADGALVCGPARVTGVGDQRMEAATALMVWRKEPDGRAGDWFWLVSHGVEQDFHGQSAC